VIRRLRTHSELLSARQGEDFPKVMLSSAETPGSFVVRSIYGEPVSRRTLVGEQLIGFFSPGCEPRKEEAAAGDAGEFLTRLEPVAWVVVEKDVGSGAVSRAFKRKGFPVVCPLDAEGTVTASGPDGTRPAVPRLAS
jgi:hypothetical protein